MAAFDSGVRREEMMLIQLKHINFKPIAVKVEGEQKQLLSIEVQSKGEKTTGEKEFVYVGTERLKEALQKRRFALHNDPEAYVFGTEDGRRQKGFLPPPAASGRFARGFVFPAALGGAVQSSSRSRTVVL